MTVSGPDTYIRREFGPGERPSFTPDDNESNPLLDGVYTWELRLNSTQLTHADDGTNGRDPKVTEASRRATRGPCRSDRLGPALPVAGAVGKLYRPLREHRGPERDGDGSRHPVTGGTSKNRTGENP